LKFNRLSQLSQDVVQIANALQESELIEVSEDKAKIRRSPEVPLPDNTLEYWQEIKRRTAYVVSCFPLIYNLYF
jgi:lupus La protein